MMKWGRRKPSSASSSRPSFMSHASPLSWLSKFKQMRVNSEPNPGKLKQKGMQNALSVSCSPQYACGNGGKFYGGDDDAFCRLSFGDESHANKKSKEILKSAESSLDNEHAIPSSSCHSGKRNSKKNGSKEGTLKFKKDICLREERNLAMDTKIPMEMDEYNREKEFEKLKRKFERKAQRVLQEQILKLEREEEAAEIASNKSVQKDVLQLESPRTILTPRKHSFAPSVDSKNSSLRAIREDCLLSTRRFDETNGLFEEKLGSGQQNLKQIEQLKAKTDKQRHSLHASREKQRRKPKHIPKVRVYSPRMASKVEICKIKALEDMRKAKLKKKKEEEKIVEETADLDTFAVVKRSLNPQQDFRDSMIEMITERQISQPEEMEELLACYLTLNSDEYHDLIIKVFRQVWFDMNTDSVGIKLNKHFCL